MSIRRKYLRGKIRSDCYYENNVKHGMCIIYHNNSSISKKYNYVNGVISGRYTRFHNNGVICDDMYRNNDTIYNYRKRYDQYGNLIVHDVYVNNRVLQAKYTNNILYYYGINTYNKQSKDTCVIVNEYIRDLTIIRSLCVIQRQFRLFLKLLNSKIIEQINIVLKINVLSSLIMSYLK
jgi:hypothetical protein